MNFAEWIDSQLIERGWSRREAAKRAGLSPSIFDKVINGYSEPGLEFLKGISKIFNLPLIKVLNLAGITDVDPESALTQEGVELLHLFDQLSPDDQDEIIRIARMKIEIRGHDDKKKRNLHISTSSVNPD